MELNCMHALYSGKILKIKYILTIKILITMLEIELLHNPAFLFKMEKIDNCMTMDAGQFK